jgi:hypothetical protein
METSQTSKSPINLLVIECQRFLNWYKIFEGAELNGRKIVVEQAEYEDISLVSHAVGGVYCSLR